MSNLLDEVNEVLQVQGHPPATPADAEFICQLQEDGKDISPNELARNIILDRELYGEEY